MNIHIPYLEIAIAGGTAVVLTVVLAVFFRIVVSTNDVHYAELAALRTDRDALAAALRDVTGRFESALRSAGTDEECAMIACKQFRDVLIKHGGKP